MSVLELIEIFDNVVFDELIAQMRVHSGDEEGQYVYYHCTGHPWSVREHVCA